MKKAILFVILSFFVFTPSFAMSNNIYDKIDIIYSKFPDKLNLLNEKIKELVKGKYNGTKYESILKKMI